MRSRVCRGVAAAGLTLLFATPLPGHAEGANDASDPNNVVIKQFKADLSVPKSPALSVLGVTSEEVIRPDSPKALAAGILQGVDPRGNLQTGLALDTTPYMLFSGNGVTLHEYKDSFAVQLLANTSVSLATAKGTNDDDKGTRLALGFRVTPWSLGDLRRDEGLLDCFGKHLREPSSPAVVQVTDELFDAVANGDQAATEKLIAQRKPLLEAEFAPCREEARKRNWNRSSVALGAAPTWLSEDGSLNQLKWNGASFWASGAYGFDTIPGLKDTSQILATVRYVGGESVPTNVEADPFVKQDTLSVGAQIRLGVYSPDPNQPPTFILNAEGDWLHAAKRRQDDDSSYRVSLGADVKIPGIENTYLKIIVGGSGGAADATNAGFILANFKVGLQ